MISRDETVKSAVHRTRKRSEQCKIDEQYNHSNSPSNIEIPETTVNISKAAATKSGDQHTLDAQYTLAYWIIGWI